MAARPVFCSVSSRLARAGVLVRLPENRPAAKVAGMPKASASPAVTAAANSSAPSTSRLSRRPRRLNEAKKPGPDASPMVYTNSTRPRV